MHKLLVMETLHPYATNLLYLLTITQAEIRRKIHNCVTFTSILERKSFVPFHDIRWGFLLLSQIFADFDVSYLLGKAMPHLKGEKLIKCP